MSSFFSNPQSALKEYLRVGFHIEENVLSHSECDVLIQAASQLNNAKNQSFRPEMMPHRQCQHYLAALSHPKIHTIMRELIGEVVMGLQTELFFGKPGTRGFSLHQDNFFVQAPFGAFASAWIALTDIYPKKGGLIIYPESQQAGLLPTRKLEIEKDAHQDPNANNEECIVPPQYSASMPSVNKGGVIFIHGHLVHGSNPNLSQEWRYVLLNTYIRQGAPFRSGLYAKREAIAL